MTDGALPSLSQCPDFRDLVDPTPRVAPKVSLQVKTRPVGIEEDRAIIRQTAKRIEMLDARCNAVETHIAKGAEFAALHEELAKNKPNDKTHIGWKRAFEPEENKFGICRRYADSFIIIHRAFAHRGNMFPPSQLPSSFRPLVALARLLVNGSLTEKQLRDWIQNGLIKPTTDEANIKALAKQFELVPKRDKSPNEPAPAVEPTADPLDAAWEQHPELRSALAQKREIEILDAMSAQQRERLFKQREEPPKLAKPKIHDKLSNLLEAAVLDYRAGHKAEASNALEAILRLIVNQGLTHLAIVGAKAAK